MTGWMQKIRPWTPTAALLLMAAVVAFVGTTGGLTGPAAAAQERRDVLLSYLPDADHVSYARNVLYLYAKGDPLMVVWVEDDPAELYDAQGTFVAPLDFQELSRVIRRAGTLMRHDRLWSTTADARDRNQA